MRSHVAKVPVASVLRWRATGLETVSGGAHARAVSRIMRALDGEPRRQDHASRRILEAKWT